MPRVIPDARLHRPEPDYLRALIRRAGVTQARAAQIVGVTPQTIRRYLTDADSHQDAPYAVQFALECLAAYKPRGRRKGTAPPPVE